MMSVAIATLDDEAVLGRALAPLVAAAVSGFVREVIVADGGSSDATLEIAEDAGCRIVRSSGDADARLGAAAREARCDWLMILPPAIQLLPGWEAALRPALERGAKDEILMPALDPEAGWLKRVFGLGAPAVRVVRTQAVTARRPAAPARLHGCAVLIRGA